MKTLRLVRLACAVALALLSLSSAVITGAAPSSPTTAAGAQNSRKKATARKRRARRRAAAPEAAPAAPSEVRTVAVPDTVPPAGDVPVTPAPTPRKTVVQGGVLNGKAVSKPAPEYPAIAKAARASGTVTVQIVVGEDGRVISANAVSGHPLLQQAAVAAARQARFSPTLLSGQPVKVSGVITYNFVLQ